MSNILQYIIFWWHCQLENEAVGDRIAHNLPK